MLTAKGRVGLVDPAFGEFIQHDVDHEKIDQWRASGRGSAWTALWPTFIVIIVLLALFLLSAGREALNAVLAVVGALPIILGVITAIRNGGVGKS